MQYFVLMVQMEKIIFQVWQLSTGQLKIEKKDCNLDCASRWQLDRLWYNLFGQIAQLDERISNSTFSSVLLSTFLELRL